MTQEPPIRPELVVRVHGCSPPAMRVYERDTAREHYLRAAGVHVGQTSCSVIVRDAERGDFLLHLLIDAGLGVMESLVRSRMTFGVERLDAVFLTHGHYDHIAGLPQISEGVRGAHHDRGDRDYYLPVYCTAPTAEQVFGERGAFAFILTSRVASITHRPVATCEPVSFAIPGGESLMITPVSVDHGPSAPGAVIYVVQALGKKVIFAWDVLQIIEEPEAPTEAQQARFVSALPRHQAELVHDADVLFLDSTTWNPRPSYGHISILEGLVLARRWRAARTYWIHYGAGESKDEKPLSPLLDLPDIDITRSPTDPELHWLAGRVSTTLNLDIRVAYAGLTLPQIDAWPDGHPTRLR